MIRIQTETRTEMMCMQELIKQQCSKCGYDGNCEECNYNNVTYELIDLNYSKPVKRWDFNK